MIWPRTWELLPCRGRAQPDSGIISPFQQPTLSPLLSSSICIWSADLWTSAIEELWTDQKDVLILYPCSKHQPQLMKPPFTNSTRKTGFVERRIRTSGKFLFLLKIKKQLVVCAHTIVQCWENLLLQGIPGRRWLYRSQERKPAAVNLLAALLECELATLEVKRRTAFSQVCSLGS